MKKAAFIILFFIVFGFSLTLSSVISAPSVPGKYDFSQEQMYIEKALNMNENIEIQPIHDKNLENKVKDYIKKVHKVIAHMQRNRQTMIRVFSLLIVVLFMLLSCVFYYSFYLKRRSIKPVVKKYEQSTLTAQKADQHLNRLLRYMEEEKPYLEFELTLGDIARQLSIPQKELSQVINERLNKNFCTFINEYRIQEARRLLLGNSGKTLSVLDIAYESGFNSKTSFNMVFKKHLQMTPTHFRKIYHHITLRPEEPGEM
ncbi:MAG: helix-turn-helix domain-containing protein [Candidatus Aminicenantes bacterium]|jgi:AraC-like DNA-binding protein